ncbi:MAG: hypothetical protein L3J20_07345 [Flavobacteriaceae bacterium]|nr:hypothetical protein [Flavobacteriaceae bacterium]
MRKLSILLAFAVLSLVSTTTFAQEAKEEVKEIVQDKVEIQISELPEAVTKTLGEQFAEFTAEKAYKSVLDEKEVYYVKLVKDGEYSVVLIDAEGNVIQKEEPKQ